MTLACISCNKELETAVPQDIVANQPYGGTTFTSRGQYGSTVWDPFHLDGGEFLEINVCDQCLVKKKDLVLRGELIHKPTETIYFQWDPDEER